MDENSQSTHADTLRAENDTLETGDGSSQFSATQETDASRTDNEELTGEPVNAAPSQDKGQSNKTAKKIHQIGREYFELLQN